MGGVQNFASDPLGASVNLLTMGSFGSGGYLTDAGFKKDKDDDGQQQQSSSTATQEKATPKAAKVDGAKSILSKQSNQRKRYLLQQSTGQAPQAPSLSQQSPTRNLLGG